MEVWMSKKTSPYRLYAYMLEHYVYLNRDEGFLSIVASSLAKDCRKGLWHRRKTVYRQHFEELMRAAREAMWRAASTDLRPAVTVVRLQESFERWRCDYCKSARATSAVVQWHKHMGDDGAMRLLCDSCATAMAVSGK
jgi:NAD-dependent SIR2 family protein deacetylase